MQVIRDLEAMASWAYPVVALGNFDGVHLGHRAILKAAVERARAAAGTALALTFEPQPAKLLSPERAPRLIVAPEDKLEMLAAAGLDAVIVLDFTLALSRLTPREFARDYLVGRIGAREVVVGHSVSFGHRRAGNAAVIVELGGELGFTATVVGPVRVGALEVSSTRIRRLIAAGDLRAAAALLGRNHFLSGVVVPGDGRGRRLGFPTANLQSATECVPPHGIYATRVVLPEAANPSATSIGVRPTFGRSEPTIETYIFDFDHDLYGTKVRVEFVERIRDELRFESVEALKAQMALDVRRAREILARA